MAAETLEKTGAAHVVYCTVEYSPDNTPVEVNFYMQPLDDSEFYKRTEAAAADAQEKGRTMYIGAVHRHE